VRSVSSGIQLAPNRGIRISLEVPVAARTRKRIDINAADPDAIERACGIDGVLAQRIVAYRDKHGPFKTREDLDKVPGFADVRTQQVLSAVDLPASDGEKAEATQRRATGTRSTSRRPAASRSGGQATSRSAEPTIDHDFIRRWVEERGGWPARVKRTGRSRTDTGMIRIDFPGFSGRESLERIEWDEWFQQFDDNGLAFLHRDMRHSDGDLDRFNKLVRRDGGSDK